MNLRNLILKITLIYLSAATLTDTQETGDDDANLSLERGNRKPSPTLKGKGRKLEPSKTPSPETEMNESPNSEGITIPTEGSAAAGQKKQTGRILVAVTSANNVNEESYNIACNRSQIDAMKRFCEKKAKPSELDIFILKEQNKILLSAMIHNVMATHEMPEFEPISGFKLLEKTFKIYQKMCPICKDSFLTRIESSFKLMNYHFATMRSDYFAHGGDHINRINGILDVCLLSITPQEFILNTCKDAILATAGANVSFICTKGEEETNIRLYDPILDSMWSIINAVHSGCFSYFQESSEMWHRYFLALMDTISIPVQKRWDSQVEDPTFWKHVLGPFYEKDLANLQRCTKVVVDTSELGKYNIPIGRGQFIPYVRMIGSI